MTADELLILFRYPVESMSANAKKQARRRIKVKYGLSPEPGCREHFPTYSKAEANAAWAKRQQLRNAA